MTRKSTNILRVGYHYCVATGTFFILAALSGQHDWSVPSIIGGTTSQVNLEFSFNQTKHNFYALVHLGHFHYDTFDTFPSHIPLAAVSVEFFLVRPISQWRAYLELFDLSLSMSIDQVSSFYQIGPWSRLDFGVLILCKIVNFLSSAHRSDTKFLRNQVYHSPDFNIDRFQIASLDSNLLVQRAFPHGQYPFKKLHDNTRYLLLLRAFQWVHQPHSLASLMKHASEAWVQLFDLLLTRPSVTTDDPVDTSVDACANRLLELHPDNRSILDLYPALAKDPALVSEYLLSVGAYDRNNTPICYGLQLTIVASCLVAHLQDEFGSIIIDQYLSQSDLLFILSAGR